MPTSKPVPLRTIILPPDTNAPGRTLQPQNRQLANPNLSIYYLVNFHRHKNLNRFPDIHYTLLASLQRIDEISQMESILRQQTNQND